MGKLSTSSVILTPSDDVYNTQDAGFLQYCKDYKTQRFGSWICFRPQVILSIQDDFFLSCNITICSLKEVT
jgi:hypothetical protein